jgi:hypothetical protein
MSLVTSSWPRTHTALYLPAPPRRAAPPCISGRTSYLRVRLAFHPYPQLLPWFCNTSGCEPRRIVTSASLWPWVAHTVSGPIAATCLQVPLAAAPSSDSVSLRLPSSLGRLTCGNDDALAGSFYKRHAINPLVAPARTCPSRPGSARRPATAWASDCFSRTRFQVLFHPPLGVLFTLPSRYSVRYRSLKVFSLGGWSPLLPTGFLVPCGTQGPAPVLSRRFPLQDSHLLWCGFPATSGTASCHPGFAPRWPYNPAQDPLPAPDRFRLFPVRSPLLRESRLISLRRATKMFQFTRCPSCGRTPTADLRPSRRRGCPIRILRDHRLPAAPPERFAARRVLLRPSAPRHPPRTLLACAASATPARDLFAPLLSVSDVSASLLPRRLRRFISLSKIEARHTFSC